MPTSRLTALASAALPLLLLACGPEEQVEDVPAVFGDELGTFSMPGGVDIAVLDDRAFICQATGQVVVLDIAVADAVAEVDSIPSGEGCIRVTGWGSEVFITDVSGELGIYRPNTLALIGVWDAAGPISAAAFNTGKEKAWLVEVVDELPRIEVVDFKSVGSPRLANVNNFEGLDAVVAETDNNNLYLVEAAGNLRILGLDLEELSTWTPPSGSLAGISGMAAVDDVLYLPGGPEGLWVLDVSNPEEPVQLGAWTGGTAWDAQAVGGRIYVGADAGLAVLDVSSPSSPSLVGGTVLQPTITGAVESVWVEAGRAYALAPSSGQVAILHILE